MIKKLKNLSSILYHKLRFRINKRLRSQIHILSSEESIDYIITNRCSLCRYGDGEFNMMKNYIEGNSNFWSFFQPYHLELGKKLYEILHGDYLKVDNLRIGLPNPVFGEGTSKLVKSSSHFWEVFSNQNLKLLLSMIPPKETYLDTQISRFYIDLVDKSKSYSYVEKLKKLWKNRNLLIIEGSGSRLGVNNNLFENATSIRRIIAPSQDAFSKYNDILEEVVNNANKEDLILIALGMTATILAYDLAKEGFQAIDIGHVDIEYEWMLMKAETKVPVRGKYTNEAKAGHNPVLDDNPIYESQIIKVID